jgi:predicted Zn-dependent peptidase
VFLPHPPSLPLTEDRYLGWAILNALIGDTMSSRLFQLLREEGGYCYSVYSSPTFHEDTGLWCAYASSEKRKILPLAQTLVAALRDLLTHGPTTAEIDAAREHLCGEEIICAEDMESRMKRLMLTHRARFPHRTPEAVIDRIRRISETDLAALLPELLNLTDAALVIHGPRLTPKTIAALNER